MIEFRLKTARSWVCLALILAALTTNIQAAIWYVDAGATGSGNGMSWTNAFTNLPPAIAAAGSADQVWVAAGTYKPGTNRSDTFTLKSNVSILCGFVFGDTSVAQQDPINHVVILSGEIGTASETDNCYHVITIPVPVSGDFIPPSGGTFPEKANLDGATITRGFDDDVNDGGGGGGIFALGNENQSIIAVIRRCIVTDNKTMNTGGGFWGNDYTDLTFRDCNFNDNEAPWGGAMASGAGGTMTPGSLTILNCIIEYNSALYLGGGIWSSAGELKVVSSTIEHNSADYSGGGIYVVEAAEHDNDVTLINTKIVSNSADTYYGGGVYIANGSGGGATTGSLINCTIADNFANAYGGGWFSGTPNYTLNIVNSIIWENSAGDNSPGLGREMFVVSGTVLVDYSDVRLYTGLGVQNYGTLTFGTGNIGTNTTTDDPNFDGAFRIDCSSACLDVGNNGDVLTDADDVNENSYTSTENTPDRDLNVRVVATVDMGAYEVQPTESCIGDLVPLPCRDGVVNSADLLYLLSQWGPCPAAPSPCYADIAGVTHQVDVDDLLALNNHWGACDQGGDAPIPPGGDEQFPALVQDCIDNCGNDIECLTECLHDAGVIP